MSNILSAIKDDMDEYEALCRRFGESVVTSWCGNQLLPDCYGEHATALKQRAREEDLKKLTDQWE